MKTRNIAALLTCHNRKDKTMDCLASLYRAECPGWLTIDIFLTDDGSTDGTSDAVKNRFPQVNLIKGDGNLFWAGGMRLAWRTAMLSKEYDAYLLINDDVRLTPDFIENLLKTDQYSLEKTKTRGIYSGITVDEQTGKVTYGGSLIKTNHIVMKMQMLAPQEFPQQCEITNANVLWVSKEVVNKIGIFNYRFTHGIADYDYSLQARKKKMPVYLASGICGTCSDDHGKNWKNNSLPLKDRIAYLKSPKGLAYDEYLYFIRSHFPLFLPYSFIMLWMKTFFPFMWDKLKS